MDKEHTQQNSLENYEGNGLSLRDKADKIVAALYMVTDCLEDNEPMKYKFRSLGIEFVLSTHELVLAPSFDRKLIFPEIELASNEIRSLLKIGALVGSISEMNRSILQREIDGLETRLRNWVEIGFYIRDTNKSGTVASTLPGDFFNQGTHQQEVTRREERSLPQMSTFSSAGQNYHQKDTRQQHSMQTAVQKQKDTLSSSNKKFDLALKINRRNVILKLIRDKKEVTIKDITSVIADCSEKTVQRELLTLVGEGVLKRIGEKRWSKYMLA